VGGNSLGTEKSYSYGMLTVSGAGSTAVVTQVRAGDASQSTTKGDVVVEDGALLSMDLDGIYLNNASSLTIKDATVHGSTFETGFGTTKLAAELGNKSKAEYYLYASVFDVHNSTTLDITLAGDFSAILGDTIKLFDWDDAGRTGTFDNLKDQDTFTSGSYEFRFNDANEGASESTLTVTAIPEPASILLLVSGLVAAYKLRRRS
jgi:hypothetical protein